MMIRPHQPRAPPHAYWHMAWCFVLLPTCRCGKKWDLLRIIGKDWEAVGKLCSKMSYLCTRFRSYTSQLLNIVVSCWLIEASVFCVNCCHLAVPKDRVCFLSGTCKLACERHRQEAGSRLARATARWQCLFRFIFFSPRTARGFCSLIRLIRLIREQT